MHTILLFQRINNLRLSSLGFLKLFKRNQSETDSKNLDIDRGILVFDNTSEVIRAETILKTAGWDIRVMGPPPEIRSGCDLVIEFPLI
jgi:hypothetical protein